MYSGYRNTAHIAMTDRGLMNFIVYKREVGIAARIRRANDIGNYVAAHGLPARATADTRILKIGQRYGALYRYLPGETIPWEAYTMKHIKLLGWVMGDMHAALVDYSAVLPSAIDEYREVIARMKRYFERADVSQALMTKLHLGLRHDTISHLEQTLQLHLGLPSQALHMDFVRGNVLFREAANQQQYAIGSVELSGVLDFEKASCGPVVFDIARTLAFLLVDCHGKSPDKVYKYFLTSGYNKRSRSRFDENAPGYVVLEQTIMLFLMYDFYKFLRDNPYESLPANHHFCQTRDILIARKVLQYNN